MAFMAMRTRTIRLRRRETLGVNTQVILDLPLNIIDGASAEELTRPRDGWRG
jgi:hypothetical protein